MYCAQCSRSLPADARFCPACATAVGSDEPPATVTHVGGSPSPSLGSGPAVADAQSRYLPGTVLGGRYRVVGLIGRGGMGEVYRADDLKLGQPVALKFLPGSLNDNPDRLARFLNEVKLARQVSHANVCRVYDVGELDGHHYLSMEYVDGEDLSSLLKRIGRFPEDKAVQMARQLCAGLAAAHEQGILHRDLKPGNVLIDGRGRLKLSDFGLAGMAESIEGDEVRVGTPAYQAPEQRSGEAVSVRSDLYSLGLVLYEMFTGEPAFRADSMAELVRLQTESAPPSLSSHVATVFDPAVERIVLRCLDTDPARRPASALAVAAGLPGGDPLAAALAAGETPSPELVAAAGETIEVPRWLPWICLAAVVVLLPVGVWISARNTVPSHVPLELAPQVLDARSRELVRELGYDDDDAPHRTHGLSYAEEQLRYLRSHAAEGELADELATAEPTPVRYWHRSGPLPIEAASMLLFRPGPNDPPMSVPGMTRVDLDAAGRLLGFLRVPTDRDAGFDGAGPDGGEAAASTAGLAAPDWSRWFDEAGLDLRRFDEAAPDRVPPVFADGARAWRGNHPDHDDVEIRVRGATLGGRVVQFQVEHGWHAPAVPPSLLRRINAMVINLLVIGLLVGAVFLARANVRQGRGDLKGAKRFAGCILLLFVLWWALGAAHASGGTVFVQLLVRVGLGLLQAGAIWGVYLALEPFVRRRWPDLLVSWTRLLDGRWRDPLVGRDLVLGSALAMALVLLDGLTVAAPAFVGGQVPYLQPPLDPLLGGRLALAGIAQFQLTIFVAMLILLVLTLARFVLKRDWAAFVTAALFSTAVFLGNAVNANLQTVFLLVFAVLFVALLMRFGLLAGMVALVVHAPLAHTAVTVDFGSWHADPTLYAVGLVVVVTLYGFVVSFGGRSMLGDPVLDDS